MTVYAALNEVKKAIGAVGKGERNSAQGFNFRGIDAVVNAAAPHLNEHGIITVPEVLDCTYDTVEVGAKRTAMGHVTLKASYHFYGPEGDRVTATVMSESMDAGDKAMAKAMSVAYRIALLQVLNLPTTEADPDSESFERSGQSQNTANPAPARKSASTPVPATLAEIAEKVKSATDVNLLRELYKAAGDNGLLQQKAPIGGNVTLEKYILTRVDDVNHSKSANGVAAGAHAPGAS